MLANGFADVRLVGGSGDRGADILGVKDDKLWVVQCKYTSSAPPPVSAVSEVVEAGKYYGADRLLVAISRHASQGMVDEIRKHARFGLVVEILGPGTLLNLMTETPEYPPGRRRLRPYQAEACERFRRALTETGLGQVVMATGLGKTVVMAETVARLLREDRIQWNRVLVMAHTVDIVRQLHHEFWLQLPKWIPTHQLSEGEAPSHWDGITFATIQSVSSRLSTMPRFGLVLVDEAHHVGMATFRSVLESMSPLMVGGVTATPWRGDEFDIDGILGPAVAQVGIAEGLRNGFLTEVSYKLLADNLDWNFVQEASRFGYSLSQLNRRLIIPTRDEVAAKVIAETFASEKRRGGIVFSPSIVHAESFAAVLRQIGLRTEPVTSNQSPRERDVLMSRFRSGRLQFLTTVDLFNEGVDFPDVDIVVFLRVTHSRRIFVQQLGRGLRVSPGKDKVVVLDFVTDLRRIAEVLELDQAVRSGEVERLGLGSRIVDFVDKRAGSFLQEWLLDQASLVLREGDPKLQLPRFEFPPPPPPGNVE